MLYKVTFLNFFMLTNRVIAKQRYAYTTARLINKPWAWGQFHIYKRVLSVKRPLKA